MPASAPGAHSQAELEAAARNQSSGSQAARVQLRRAWQRTLDFFFPPVCAGCERLGWSFCPACAQAVTPAPATVCSHCGRVFDQAIALCGECRGGALDALDAVRSAALFGAPLRQAIHAFKYGGRPELAGPLARYLVAVLGSPAGSEIGSTAGGWPVDVVVPVPLHGERFQARGYNQSALLAHAFAAGVGVAYAEDWLARVRATRPQVGLDAAARQENVADAFVALPVVAGKSILLVDDVFTTGATLQACAQAARRAGARRVYGATLAAARGAEGQGGNG